MYNQWQLQQIAAMQLAALQNQLMAQNFGPQQLQFPLQQPVPISDEDESDDDEDDESERTLFVNNLDRKVTEELFYEIFLQAGPIETVRIPKDGNGQQRNFGFIVYVHKCSALYAAKLFQGLTLFDKMVNIRLQGRLAQAQDQRPNDVEIYRQRRNDSANCSNNSSFDNTPKRISRVSNASPPAVSGANPFRRYDEADSEAIGVGPISKHASSQMRPHHNDKPYQRRSGGADRDRGREHHSQQQQQHNRGGNRRSEQRKNDRR